MKRLFLLLAATAAFTQSTACGDTPSGNSAKYRPADVYRLLGYATMSGESPLKLWEHLRDTQDWLVGPLSPDAWAGQVFVADHADIFAFRFLPVPAAWTKESTAGHRAEYCAGKYADWFKNWPGWWKVVGPKAWDNSYARLVWQMPDGGPEVTYEWAQVGPQTVVGRITQSSPCDLVIEGYSPWMLPASPRFAIYTDGPERRSLHGRSWLPGTRDGMRWVLALSAPAQETTGNGGVQWHGFYPQVKTLYFAARQGQTYEQLEPATRAWLEGHRIDDLLESNRARYLQTRPVGSGWLADAPAAINDQIEWSEVYTPSRRRPYLTVSRAWAQSNNSAPDFLWDSFFTALLVSQEDRARSFNMMRDVTAWQNDQGMFAQYGEWFTKMIPGIFPVAWGHTQYPLGALAAAKIGLRWPDRRFLAELYPRLLKHHRWWLADRGDGQPWRDGNRNGLLELGSNYPEEIGFEARQQSAYYESYDDSPQWWGVARYNTNSQTLELDTVERNCLYALDSWMLAWMAEQVGKSGEARALRREHEQMKERINRLLWDPERKCYFNRPWQPKGGQVFMPQVSPDVFFALLGKVADAEQATALRKLFHDPAKFAGEWILPTISRDDPLYPKQDYWRGKVWAPVNYLVYQGLKINEWDHEAHLLAKSSAKMFFKAWREKAECRENFLSTTGEGSSDPHYTWGALMALIAVEELIDINPWHGLRFGNLEPVEAAGLERYPVAGALYDVQLSDQGLTVKRDGKPLFAAAAPVEIRRVEFRGDRVQCEVRAGRPGQLSIGANEPLAFAAGLTRFEGRLPGRSGSR
ncbi:MAG: trehalase family glycosidase [Verrucomicrobiota bacterium]